MTPTMRRSLMTVTVACAAFLASVSKLDASDSQPLTYFRMLPVEAATAWKACLEETKESQGYRIESSRKPYVLWLFFEYGDVAHPISELSNYADTPDTTEYHHGRAVIKLTVQTIKADETRISATGFFQLMALPTSAAYLPLRSKSGLERKIVDSVAQRLEPKR
jgi:hypothetical protein